MVKEQGSLGFTLRKEDESVLGHCVRALVRQPATTDGRIQPGDKIVAVNDVEMCQLTHEQAVVFLRMAGDTVKLRLYRDEAQTPTTGPPSGAGAAVGDSSVEASGVRAKTSLRPEAMTLLSDLACRNRKLHALSSETDLSGASMRSTTNTSPRRLKRGGGGGGHKSGSSGTTTTTATSTSDEADNKSGSFSYPRYIVTSQPTTSVGSDSEASSSISQCSFVVQPADGGVETLPMSSLGDANDYYEEDELWVVDDDDEADGAQGSAAERVYRGDRSSVGCLAGKSGSTPVSSRKPRFQFTGKCYLIAFWCFMFHVHG